MLTAAIRHLPAETGAVVAVTEMANEGLVDDGDVSARWRYLRG